MKKIVVLFFLTVLTTKSWCQNVQGPPPAAAPVKENIILIDQLMQVSGYEEYFKEYCYKEIAKAGVENKWSADIIKSQKSKVNFSDFKDYTIYNAFSSTTTSQLKDLIKLVKEINHTKGYTGFFITNSMIQSNLEGFVRRYCTIK